MLTRKNLISLFLSLSTAAFLTACGQCNCSCCSNRTDTQKTTDTSVSVTARILESSFDLRSAVTEANSSAKTLFTATQSALTDLDTEDVFNTGRLTGSFQFTKSDFENLEDPNNKEKDYSKNDIDAMISVLKYKIRTYFTDAERIPAFAVELKTGSARAVAVQLGPFKTTESGKEFYLYGSSPMQASANQTSSMTLTEALENASYS